MWLMTLSNLYAFLKPKTLTFELSLSLSLSPLCLGSCRFPFLSLYLKPLPYKPSPFTHLLLLCSLFADFSVFSGNLYDFTLDLKFSAFFSLKNIQIASDGWIRTLFQKIRVCFLLLLFLIFWDFRSKSHKADFFSFFFFIWVKSLWIFSGLEI